MAWNPETHPYRVLPIMPSSGRGMHGWRYGEIKTFETVEAAKEFAATIKGARKVKVQKVSGNFWIDVK